MVFGDEQYHSIQKLKEKKAEHKQYGELLNRI
jgi:hypothetical protein